jgi:L-iditol 2-dehydrogenase
MGAGFNGVVFALLARSWGADHVALLDRVPVRLARAEGLGIRAFNVDDADYAAQVRAWSGGDGAGVVIVTPSKIPAIQSGLEMVAPGGTLLLYGPPAPGNPWALDLNYTFFKEIDIRSSYSASPYDTRRALSLMTGGVLDWQALITHRFPLAHAEDAWQLTRAAGDSLKVIVEL